MSESFKLAFEPFAKFDPGKPFKLLPEGLFYRGKRKLEITRDRLLEIARHFKSGLPQFRVPINLDHKDDQGKVGNITDLEYMDGGPDGPGLYVTGFELTDKGRKVIDEDGYDAVSAEVVWTLAGHTFQDVETGKQHDNVLVGMALTPTPFFGHGHVALYSADPGYEYEELPYGGAMTWDEYDEWAAIQDQAAGIDKTLSVFTNMSQTILRKAPDLSLIDRLKGVSDLALSMRGRLKDETLSDDAQSENLVEEAVDVLPENFEADKPAEEEKKVTEEKDVMSADELREKLSTSQGEVEKLSATVDKLTEVIERMGSEQREKELREKAEGFKALGIPVDEYVAKVGKLIELDEELAEWVEAKFAAFDKAIEKAGAMDEIGTDAEDETVGADKFVKLIEAEVKEGMSYGDATRAVAQKHPDLAAEYRAGGK